MTRKNKRLKSSTRLKVVMTITASILLKAGVDKTLELLSNGSLSPSSTYVALFTWIGGLISLFVATEYRAE